MTDEEELGMIPESKASGIGKAEDLKKVLVEPERDNQYVAIADWMRSQGLPEEYTTWFLEPQGARDVVKVTYDSGEVFLKVDPPAAPHPSVTKMKPTEIDPNLFVTHLTKGVEWEGHDIKVSTETGEDFGLTAEQLQEAVKGFISRSSKEDIEEVAKLVGNAEDLAERIQAMMPHYSEPLNVENGKVVPTESYRALAGDLEMGHEREARERLERTREDIVQFSSALVRSVLEYIETWR